MVGIRVLISFILIWNISVTAYAGPLCSLGSWNGNGNINQPSPLALQQMAQVNNVLCRVFNCPQYLFFQSSGTANAMAYSDLSGNYVLYSPKFMNDMLRRFGSKATIGVLGHELGHLIDFATNPGNISQRQREANADRMAGCAFALAGEPENELIYMARTLHFLGASPGYPTPRERVGLLRLGYRQCR